MKTSKTIPCDCHTLNHSRRQFLVNTLVAGAALSLPGLAVGSQISRLRGSVWVNGKRADHTTKIAVGDTVHTGRNASITFVQGQDAYLLRERSFLALQGDSLVDVLRLTTGAVLAVFGKGKKTLKTSHATAGIRGTGIYMSTEKDRTYFCTCYGEVELQSADGQHSETIQSTLAHTARYVHAHGHMGFDAAGLIDHGIQELELLESLVGRNVPEGYTPDAMM